MKKKIFLFTKIFVVTLSLLTVNLGVLSAQQTPVSYLSPVYKTGGATAGIDHWDTLSCTTYTAVASGTDTWGTAGTDSWYVLNSDVTINHNVTCHGNVHLILMNGYTLNTKTIVETGGDGNSFAVYAQDTASSTMGILIATGSTNCAGIGGESNTAGTNIAINGGQITAMGGDYAAGIGGGNDGIGTNIIINGGNVVATGGSYGAGIGAGLNRGASDIRINGGTVTATASENGYASAIGTGGVNRFALIGSYHIFVADNIILKADTVNPPVTVIAHDSITTDITSALYGLRYVKAGPAPAPDTTDYLHFVSLKGGKFQLNKQGRTWGTLDAELEYSKDRETWTAYHWTYYNGDEITTNVHDTVWFRAGGDSHKNASLSRANTAFYYFKITNDDLAAGGNVMSLLDASCQQDTVPEYAFFKLFTGCSSLKSAPRLPATKLASNCYAFMFYYCKALTVAPELPATDLAEACYNFMFQDCSGLLKAPELSATTMKKGCYSYMLFGCSALTSAPKLQSTDLAEDCYGRMFQNCSNLIDLPELPAEVLPKGCYYEMFSRCTKLKLDTMGPGKPWSVPASTDLGTEWSKNMFDGTAGTFTGAPTAGTVYYISSVPKVKVTKMVNDIAMGSIVGPDSVYPGYTDTLVAVANAGYKLKQWSNGATTDTLIISIDKDSVFTANFESANACKIVRTGTEYAKIQDAVHASVSGDTIRMLADATENVNIWDNRNIILDLNGKILKQQFDTVQTIRVYGALTLTDKSVGVKHYFTKDSSGLWVLSEKATATDSVTGGIITDATRQAAVCVAGGRFVMEQGNIVGNRISQTGAGVYLAEWIDGNSFEMRGGLIAGNVAEYGGGVAVCKGTFTMTGGEIRNNVANAQFGVGGGVLVKDIGNFVMTGGKITGNTAATYGGGVCFEQGSITLGGTAQITGNTAGSIVNNLTLPTDSTISISSTAFANGANIGVTTSAVPAITAPVPVTTNGATTDVPFFTSDNGNYVVHFNTNHIELAVPVCEIHNGMAPIREYATVQAAVNAAAAGDTIKMTANSTENVVIATGKNITLDLNGKVLKYAGASQSSVMTLNGNANLIITDGDTAAVHYYTVGGDVLWTLNESANSGTPYESLTERPATDAVIAVKGGVITGGTGTTADIGYNGGGVLINDTAMLTLNGGNIIGNQAHAGGGVYTLKGTININGGAIAGNAAKDELGDNSGGGVYSGQGAIVMTSGSVSFNYAGQYGGGVNSNLADNASFTMTGGSVSYNYAGDEGGGIGVYRCGSLTNATIVGNVMGAGGKGGGIYKQYDSQYGGDGVLTITNCMIEGNRASEGGAIYYAGGGITLGGTTQITGNTLTDGTTANNLYLLSGKNIAISGMTALANGANIGVTTQDEPTANTPIVVSSNGALTDEQYFTADVQGQEIKYVNNHLVLRYKEFQFTLSNSINTVYTGTAHTASVTVTTPATGVTVQYSLDKGATWTAGDSYSRTNAGSDSVIFKLSASGCKDSITAPVVINIAKRSIILTSESMGKSYDSFPLTCHQITVTGDGFLPGDSVTYNFTGIQTNAGISSNTFTYTFTGNASVDIYEVTKAYGTLTVSPAAIWGATIVAIPAQIHTGSAITPALDITVNALTLIADTDYTVTYENNVNIGTARVLVTGVGNFAGDVYENFIIVPDTFDITANVNDTAQGSATGTGRYAEYTYATLTAIPAEHYHFVQWSDGSVDNPYNVYVERDSIFTACFAIDTFNVHTAQNIAAGGTVTGGGRYAYGAEVVLTATPADQYRFIQWSNGDTNAQFTYIVDGRDTTFTAIFRDRCGNDLTATDYDGNVYNTVRVGANCWTKENLRTLHYVQDGSEVSNAAVYYADRYRDTAANLATYGRLYTWHAAAKVADNDNDALPQADNDGHVQGICPAGWHLPSQAEWQSLTAFTAAELKSMQTWIDNSGNNLTGFTAVAAGYYTGIRFEHLGGNAYFWSNTHAAGASMFPACLLKLSCNETLMTTVGSAAKVSVRCVLD